MTVLSKQYALKLIREGKACREYKPLAQVTAARRLDKMYAVLARPQPDGSVRYDHYIA